MKCWSLNLPLSAPQNDASIVNMFGIYSSLYMAILAVESLYLLIENLDCSNEKKSHSFDMMYGKTLVAWG